MDRSKHFHLKIDPKDLDRLKEVKKQTGSSITLLVNNAIKKLLRDYEQSNKVVLIK